MPYAETPCYLVMCHGRLAVMPPGLPGNITLCEALANLLSASPFASLMSSLSFGLIGLAVCGRPIHVAIGLPLWLCSVR